MKFIIDDHCGWEFYYEGAATWVTPPKTTY